MGRPVGHLVVACTYSTLSATLYFVDCRPTVADPGEGRVSMTKRLLLGHIYEAHQSFLMLVVFAEIDRRLFGKDCRKKKDRQTSNYKKRSNVPMPSNVCFGRSSDKPHSSTKSLIRVQSVSGNWFTPASPSINPATSLTGAGAGAQWTVLKKLRDWENSRAEEQIGKGRGVWACQG